MKARSVRRLVAATALLVAVGTGRQASAQWLEGLTAGAASMGLGAIACGSSAFAITEIVYIAEGRQSYGVAFGSLLAGGAGIAIGYIAINEWQEGSTPHNLGIFSIVSSGLNLALMVVQLAQPFKKERQGVAVAPVALVDASGKLTAGAGLTGRF